MVLDGRGVRDRMLCFIHLLDLLMLSRYTTAVNKPSTILRFPTEFGRQEPLAKLGSVATGVEVVTTGGDAGSWDDRAPGPVHGSRDIHSVSLLYQPVCRRSHMAESYFNQQLAEVDPEIAAVLDDELGRQRDYLEMIASENLVPVSVLQSQGSVLTNKYAEGYPGRRYYGGCEFVDVAESLAIERARSLFGAAYANVQPHSGATA